MRAQGVQAGAEVAGAAPAVDLQLLDPRPQLGAGKVEVGDGRGRAVRGGQQALVLAGDGLAELLALRRPV